ncbi:MAG: protein-glutamine glutaminase family protein [bacterium]|nr:protein-glutamine glutaminase family protein [bacterium]
MMKTSSSCIGWKTGVFSLIVLTLLFIGAIGCQSDSASDVTLEPQGVEYPIPENARFDINNLMLMSEDDPLKILISEYGDGVTFPGTATVFYLPKDIKNYAHYRQLLEEATKTYWDAYHKELIGKDHEMLDLPGKLKFIIGRSVDDKLGSPIIHIEKPTDQELKKLQAHKERLKDLIASDTKVRRSASLSWVMSPTQEQSFFTQFKNLSCATSSQYPCLPFQYAADGCYARAHYMRKLMADAGYDCKKIFVSDINHRLQAHTKANCCVAWRYHVAPLVYVATGYATEMMVIDPSLFDAPVLYTTWINKMKSNCKGLGQPNEYVQIKSADHYAYNPNSGAFIFDDDYSLTFYVLDDYPQNYGCN